MTNDTARRAAEHGTRFGADIDMKAADLNLGDSADALTRRQARAFEQYFIGNNEYPGMVNARNEIGRSQPEHIREGAVAWAEHMINNGSINFNLM